MEPWRARGISQTAHAANLRTHWREVLHTVPGTERRPHSRDGRRARGGHVRQEMTSSVHTRKLFNVHSPKVAEIATSAASRPRASNTRPMRGVLCRASNVYHCPPR